MRRAADETRIGPRRGRGEGQAGRRRGRPGHAEAHPDLPQHATGIRPDPTHPADTVPWPAAAPPRIRPNARPRPARTGRPPERKRHSNGAPLTRGTAAACRADRGWGRVASSEESARLPPPRPAPSTPPKMLLIAAPGTLERTRRAPRTGGRVLDGSVPTLRHERRRGAVPPPPADCVQSRSSVRFTRLCVSPNLSEAAPSFITTRTQASTTAGSASRRRLFPPFVSGPTAGSRGPGAPTRTDRPPSPRRCVTIMILLQVHLQQPCYDFCFL